jgi:DnaJ like chaperone protein
MTPAEIVISLVGLVGGYWVVSAFLNPSKPSPQNPQDEAPGPEPAAAVKFKDPSRVDASNWHQILEVAADADVDAIAAAYRRKISQYHPDKVAQMGEEIRAVAASKSQQINTAYDIGMKLRRAT